MTILYLLVPLALVLAGAGVAAFFWAVRSGQYDDVQTPAIRILLEEEGSPRREDGIEERHEADRPPRPPHPPRSF